MASRTELTKLGMDLLTEACPAASPEARGIIKAVAAMIALGPGRKKRNPADGPVLAVSPAAVYQAVAETECVLCVPVDSRWFGRLGGVMKNMPDFTQDTLTALCAWLRAGGVKTWPGGKPSFSHLITHLDKWAGRAVEWTGGAGNSEPTDWSMFK